MSSSDTKATDPEGYNVPAVENWIENNIEGLTPPFKWTRLEGGHSNLTYRLDDRNGKKVVIRRPPQGKLLPKAHDMSREWSVISALNLTSVPVPEAFGFCESPEVTGAWFYVMGLVEGRPLHSAKDTIDWVPEQKRKELGYSFIDALANLHSLDPDEIGLGDLGKKENYIGRQLKTWYRSWNSSMEAANLDDPRAHELKQYFLDHMPDQGVARVVHGDFGFHNCLVGADSKIAAVVDWELSTLGDPLADLAYVLNQFPQPGYNIPHNPEAASAPEGFPSFSDLKERYAVHTNRDLKKLDYYIGFNHWKSAAILHGVYARYIEGQKSSTGIDLDGMRNGILNSLDLAEQAVNRLNQSRQSIG